MVLSLSVHLPLKSCTSKCCNNGGGNNPPGSHNGVLHTYKTAEKEKERGERGGVWSVEWEREMWTIADSPKTVKVKARWRATQKEEQEKWKIVKVQRWDDRQSFWLDVHEIVMNVTHVFIFIDAFSSFLLEISSLSLLSLHITYTLNFFCYPSSSHYKITCAKFHLI